MQANHKSQQINQRSDSGRRDPTNSSFPGHRGSGSQFKAHAPKDQSRRGCRCCGEERDTHLPPGQIWWLVGSPFAAFLRGEERDMLGSAFLPFPPAGSAGHLSDLMAAWIPNRCSRQVRWKEKRREGGDVLGEEESGERGAAVEGEWRGRV